MENSKIGWTDHTMNFWWGCNKVSPGCTNCYIGPLMRRFGREPFDGPMRASDKLWRKPHDWNRRAAEEGRRFRVFTCSMSDFFHPAADAWRDDAWRTIRSCPHLDWLILTKRPEMIQDRLPRYWGNAGYPNVWLGVTVENSHYRHRVAELIRVPAQIHFVSAEPLLGPIEFTPYLPAIDWIITGCEKTGKVRRRPMHLDWVRSIHGQCLMAGVPHFFKQYYSGSQIREDGILDGMSCQAWPRSTALS